MTLAGTMRISYTIEMAHERSSVVAFAFLSVIPGGNLLLAEGARALGGEFIASRSRGEADPLRG